MPPPANWYTVYEIGTRNTWHKSSKGVVANIAWQARQYVLHNESKLARARELGATIKINTAEPDCVERVREASGGGVAYAFEMAGSARALELAYRVTRRGGTTVSAGLPHPQLSIPHVSLVAEERTLKGSYLGGCVPERDIPQYIEWYRQCRLPVERLLSERIVLEDINGAFDRLAAGASIRQVIEIGD